MPKFATSDELVSYCKKHSLKLSADWQGTTPNLRTGRIDDSDRASERLLELQILVPLEEGFEHGQTVEGVQTFGTVDPIWIPLSLWKQLSEQLPDDSSEIRKLSSWPVDRTFVYLDISDFSRASYGHQLLIINSLIQMVMDESLWTDENGLFAGYREWGSRQLESMICIGDGYIYAFADPVAATLFAARLACIIEHSVAQKKVLPLHFRIGVHAGPVSFFWDAGAKQWNYSGEGIVGGRRVLDAVGRRVDDVIYVSGEVRSRIMVSGGRSARSMDRESLMQCLINRGRRSDKHDRPWRVYEMNHSAVSPELIRWQKKV